MSIRDALLLARTKSIALNPETVTFTRTTKTANAATGGKTTATTTYSLEVRIVKPAYHPAPDEAVPRTGGNSVDADWLVFAASADADIIVGDKFTHPLHLSACQITGVELRAVEGEAATLCALAKEVK